MSRLYTSRLYNIRPAPESTNCRRKMLFCKTDIHNFLALTLAIGLSCLNLVNDQEQINE